MTNLIKAVWPLAVALVVAVLLGCVLASTGGADRVTAYAGGILGFALVRLLVHLVRRSKTHSA